tara:strand:+ start:7006 stop:7293 length:288 start_codon:yes stop_codon:yes gene_type:complete
MLTRKRKRSLKYKIAEIFYYYGYDKVTEEERIFWSQNNLNEINNYIKNLIMDKERLDELHLRPIKKGRREPIVKVGSVYLNDLKILQREGLIKKN